MPGSCRNDQCIAGFELQHASFVFAHTNPRAAARCQRALFGRYVIHTSWSRIASDYNLIRGGLMPIGLLVLTAAPLVAARLRHVL